MAKKVVTKAKTVAVKKAVKITKVTPKAKAPAKKAKVVAKAKAPVKKAAVVAKAKAPVKKAKVVAKAKVKTKRKPNAAFMAPLTPSKALADVIGAKPLARTEAVKKVWDYIKKNGLQDKKNKREINADAKLKAVLKKDKVTMFDLAKLLSKNLSK